MKYYIFIYLLISVFLLPSCKWPSSREQASSVFNVTDTKTIVVTEFRNMIKQLSDQHGTKALQNATFILPGRSMTAFAPFFFQAQKVLAQSGIKWQVLQIPLSNFRYIGNTNGIRENTLEELTRLGARLKLEDASSLQGLDESERYKEGLRIIDDHFSRYIGKIDPGKTVFIIDYGAFGLSVAATALHVDRWLNKSNKVIAQAVVGQNSAGFLDGAFKENGITYSKLKVSRKLGDLLAASEFDRVAPVPKFDLFNADQFDLLAYENAAEYIDSHKRRLERPYQDFAKDMRCD